MNLIQTGAFTSLSTMTRNLSTSTSSETSSTGGTNSGSDSAAQEGLCSQSLSLRKLPGAGGGSRGEVGVTSSLLGVSLAGTTENRHARRARVTRSWNGGYGTLFDGGSNGGSSPRVELAPGAHAKRGSPGNVPQQQFLRSLQRASSTILTKASSAVNGGASPSSNNNNNSCNHNHNIAAAGPSAHRYGQHLQHPAETADASRRSRIDVLLMPSLKSLVSRRPAQGPAARGGASGAGGGGGGTGGSSGAGAASCSAACDMGGSSSSSGAAGGGHHHLKSKSATAMVPLMKREASCVSLGPPLRVGSTDALGGSSQSGASGCDTDDAFAGASDSSSSPPPSVRSGAACGGGASIRKCETVLALSNLGAMLRSASSSRTTIHVEPLKPVNRLRVPPQSPVGGSTSRMCSRCSSLLSMASSSRYSLNTTGGFVQCGGTPPGETQTLLCKLCLVEVPLASTCEILQCGCCFCKDCMKSYIEFEIQEGAYDISCPDAQCDKQGVISMSEIENLVSVELVEKHRKFRLNREVDLDVNRTWCPRAGCETVCSICPMERCQPQSVHCPTCTSDFCSNCKNPWHPGLTCEENSQRLAKDGMPDNMESGIPFDSDLIKCCPMCNVPIEKDEGCAQMMCKRCKHVFCWYCLASLDDDFLLRHYDKGPCKNKLGHSRASVIWHRTQVIGIFAGFGILLLVASPLLLLAAPCIVCCKCRICSGGSKLDSEDEMPEESAS